MPDTKGKRKAQEMEAESSTVKMTVSELRELAEKGVKNLGYDDEEAAVLVDVMLYSQMRGGNQGLIKIITNGINRDPNCKAVEVEHETKLSARLNGHQTVGMVVLSKATEMAIAKAKEHGFGMVGTHNTCTSTGSIGAYVKKVADSGLIGIAFAQSPEFVAPYGSYQAILGTNPIAFGIPRKSGATTLDPLVLDMATSAYPFFGLLEAKTAGKPIPGDVAYDAKGELTTDPAAAIAGAIRVFDHSYKGSNLSLMVELLAGPLVRAATTGKKAAKNWGNLVLAIDPALMGEDTDEFYAGAEVVLQRIKEAKKLPGVTDIYLPGERGNEKVKKAVEKDEVLIEKNLHQGMVKAAAAKK